MHGDRQDAAALRRNGKSSAKGANGKHVLTGQDAKRSLFVQRYYTRVGVDPFDTVKWERRDAVITTGVPGAAPVFEQKGVEVPEFWSQMATNIVAQKYFRGHVGEPGREYSVKQLIGRVANTIAQYGLANGYFDYPNAETFRAELTHILLHQHAAFNSPVWFNIGVEGRTQAASACFIASVADDMESILALARDEGIIFKQGSGVGTNLSTLRSSKEKLKSGGTASGPVSFMRGFDSFAGVIKSGGATRRAAKMVILNVDHPDILEFIRCKAVEERKAHALIDAGFDGAFNAVDGAYSSIQFQNANNSVRVTDEFMECVRKDLPWQTKNVVDGKVAETRPAREIWDEIAKAAWFCGDPGVQFDTTINDWHTVPNTGRINATNPCAEFCHLDDTACNLASLNLMKYRADDGTFGIEDFKHDVSVMITAMEILVGLSSYPTEAITRNSYDYRPLGIGYANLGAYLMSRGLAYDSNEGREFAASVTALMTGQAYATSAKLASVVGPFAGYEKNKEPFLRVMQDHRVALDALPLDLIARAADDAWDDVLKLGAKHGFRNAQASVLAPTGTISFLMDCDTTGVEPDIALVKHKKLVGGGDLKIVNQTLPLALRSLGYNDASRSSILKHVEATGTIEGSELLAVDLPVFDCAFQPKAGKRSIHYTGHLRMMAAVQPFISGAISKTVNMPNSATPEEIAKTYFEAWEMGIKAVAIYRDDCKRSQPLTTKAEGKAPDVVAGVLDGAVETPLARRRKLPAEREAITHKFSVQNYDGYITVGKFEDGTPGEIFLVVSKEGALVSGLMDAFATSISFNLQYGVPLAKLVDKFSHMRFEPAGYTDNPRIPIAKSIIDYVFRWLADKFLTQEQRIEAGVHVENAPLALETASTSTPSGGGASPTERSTFVEQADAPPCHVCGDQMVRNASCYVCRNCAATSGCS